MFFEQIHIGVDTFIAIISELGLDGIQTQGT